MIKEFITVIEESSGKPLYIKANSILAIQPTDQGCRIFLPNYVFSLTNPEFTVMAWFDQELSE